MHTKGPWYSRKEGTIGDYSIYSETEGAFALATVRNGGTEAEAEANARLIAEAPALKVLAECIAAYFEDSDPPLGIEARSILARIES